MVGLFIWVGAFYYGAQILFAMAILSVATWRVLRGNDRATKKEKIRMAEKVIAVKETKGRKEVFQ